MNSSGWRVACSVKKCSNRANRRRYSCCGSSEDGRRRGGRSGRRKGPRQAETVRVLAQTGAGRDVRKVGRVGKGRTQHIKEGSIKETTIGLKAVPLEKPEALSRGGVFTSATRRDLPTPASPRAGQRARCRFSLAQPAGGKRRARRCARSTSGTRLTYGMVSSRIQLLWGDQRMRNAELCLFDSELSHRKRREAILMVMVLMKNHCFLLFCYSNAQVSALTVKP